MANGNKIELEPSTHVNFLDTMLALFRKQASGASGQQLAVIAHYQGEAEKQRERVSKLLRRKSPRVSRKA